ncbi:hypothetical protein, conserved [Plasmodium vivax]|uniref:Uncharacterized protein n=2 Tax=Plasmodium vivax TaxID=5855 RepID=A5K7P2_PLAVS|nr:hypothetical protein, conserved [Plasmodium vivax]EDL44801.1 hypothetical protein, conserved [Plasmodium vivax]KNA00005.1 hypothetical protein PVNG_03389 [Plasmodium vivax North Korean]|eukprot:XP_001614528.1 hypothetical protein [Plasmodium vivax Sal-1]
MKGSYDSFSKDNSDEEQSKHQTQSEKKKMMVKYMSTIEAGMKEGEVNSLKEKKSDEGISDGGGEDGEDASYVDSEDHIILTDENGALSGGTGGDPSNNDSPCGNDDDYSVGEGSARSVRSEGSAGSVRSEGRNHLSSGPVRDAHAAGVAHLFRFPRLVLLHPLRFRFYEDLHTFPSYGRLRSAVWSLGRRKKKKKKQNSRVHYRMAAVIEMLTTRVGMAGMHFPQKGPCTKRGEAPMVAKGGRETTGGTHLNVEGGSPHKSGEEGDETPFNTKDNVPNIEQMHMNERRNALFDVEIKDINDWKSKYRQLTSSFRKLEKEMNKTINSEHIEPVTRRSIKQHKDFLDNEYKEWLSVLLKTVSEFKKNIGAHVSELNEKEYLILSKNIFEDFREKYLEESHLNIVLYLTVTKHDIPVDEHVGKYLQGCYESVNTDKTLHSAIQKLLEVNAHIRVIGGRTGTWEEDEHNYFMKVYESNANLGDEVLVGMLKSCMNKSEEEIIEHVSWYKQFLSYNSLKIRCLNSISIVNVNEQRKNDSKVEEKKHMIKKWREKKQQESAIKMKELQDMKKEEMKINKIIRENIKKKKQMIQEQLNSKKEEMKKNKMEKQQKSVLSEESLQRINERNERILQKKVQSNLTLNEENNEREKKTSKQKYMHIQSKLLSNTDNLLRRIESSVETIKNIL